jgi:N-acetylneuraminic acid mutarotase
MKKQIFTLIVLLTLICGLRSSIYAQNLWTQKADFGGTETYGAVGFSNGSNGFIGTGAKSCSLSKDFWEYNPANNCWTKKVDFGGIGRYWAVGFSIGSKCYIGTGVNDTVNEIMLKDFWEYDTINNTWTRKADFGGCARYAAVGFSIGSKGYIGTGLDSNFNETSDFWEYDPTTDNWTKKADFPGLARGGAVGFSIGSKGYIGTGVNGPNAPNTTEFKDFWEYDSGNDSWTQKADFAGTERDCAIGLSINSKGYIGTGFNSTSGNAYNDFWEYDTVNNNWIQKANFIGNPRYGAVSFSIGSKGYLGTGSGDGIADTNVYENFYEYSPLGSGIEEFPEGKFFISPNPATDNLTIELPQKSIIEILNYAGQNIKTINNDGTVITIDLRNFSSGVYMIKVKIGKETVMKKFIKE